MNPAVLEEIGLSKTESRIYLTLLKIGQTTTTGVIKDSGIHASKVYEFLDKLVQKGLVSYVIKANKKYFAAADPESLKTIIREKQGKLKDQEKRLESVLPNLKALKKEGNQKINFEIYEGLRGVKSIYEKMLAILKKGDSQFTIGAPRVGNEKLEGYLLEWHKQRIERGIKCSYIYDSNVRDYGKVREQMPLTEVRYLPKNIVSPVWIEIFKDYALLGHIKESNVVMFVIHDKEIARGYLDYFKLIWKVSTK